MNIPFHVPASSLHTSFIPFRNVHI